MRYRTLGRSGLVVSDLCLGTMIFGERSARATPPDEALRLIDRFIDAGGNYLDTANIYAGGASEEIVGRAAHGRRDSIIIATKARFGTDGDAVHAVGNNTVGLSRHAILHQVDGSLRRLSSDYIDLLYVHAPDPLTPIEETMRVLDDLVRAGKVRYLGVSNFYAWQVMKALGLCDHRGWTRFVAAQYQYSLVNREMDGAYMALFAEEGLGLHPWGPLGGGFLSGKYTPDRRPSEASEGRLAITPDAHEESWRRRAADRNWRTLEAVKRLADQRGATVSQVALAWARARPTVASVIIGVRTMEQLEDNLGAAELALTDDEMRLLDEVSAPPTPYPQRMIEMNGARRT